MKKYRFILVVLFISHISSIYTQNSYGHLSNPGAGKRITVSYNNHELEIIDSLFLGDIDSLVLKSCCPYLSDTINRYFSVAIVQTEENNKEYKAIFELFPVPIADGERLGYFDYKGYTFFVRKSDLITLFRRKSQRKTFTYKRGEQIITEEYPMWVLTYKNNRLFMDYTDW